MRYAHGAPSLARSLIKTALSSLSGGREVQCECLDGTMSDSPGVEWLPAYSPGPPRHSPLGPIPRFLFEGVQPLGLQENNNKEADLKENPNKIKHAKPAYR